VVIGDTGRVDNLTEHARDADALVVEATFLSEHAEEARAFGHLTAAQAAQLAQAAGVKSLILWHVSRRYRERDVLEEARAIFPDTVVARDFDHFVVKRGQGAFKRQDPAPVSDEGDVEKMAQPLDDAPDAAEDAPND
jgi:ribonuclease Z